MRPELTALVGFIAGLGVMWLYLKLFTTAAVGGNVSITDAVCEGDQVRVIGTVSVNSGTTLTGLAAFVYDDPNAGADDEPPVGFQSFPAASSFSLLVDIPASNSGADCVAVWAIVEGYTAGAASAGFGPCTTTTTTSTTTTTTTSTTTTPRP